MDLERLLRGLAENKGSDLHLKAGRPPIMRIDGILKPTKDEPIQAGDLQQLLYSLMGERLAGTFEETNEADFSHEIPGLARFRVNIFRQRGSIGSVMRLIPLEVPTVEALELPPVLNDISENRDGLVLVTGPTGSGKSTTLAAMIEHVNQNKPVHIMTVEDPIEFTYTDAKATINQRELGLDTGKLSNALRAVLRQDPDVILMGEMRDPETIQFAVTAAETGHLVFATLHTNNAKQTVERILDTMPPDARDMVRGQMSLLLRAIVCQHLCRRKSGAGRIAALEIMINTPAISQLIEENKIRSIDRAIGEGSFYGMQTFNQALMKLVNEGIVAAEEAMEQSSSPDDLKLLLSGIQRGTGVEMG